MYDRVVIAVDRSDEAKHVARRGLEFAQVFDATVDVVHVVEQKALRLIRTTPVHAVVVDIHDDWES